MRVLAYGGINGDLDLAAKIEATHGEQVVMTVVCGDILGLDKTRALATCKWLVTRLATPNFRAVVGDQDALLLWPRHPRHANNLNIPSWAPDVRKALGESINRLDLFLHYQGVWYSHAGLTPTSIGMVGNVVPDTADDRNLEALKSLEAGQHHPLTYPGRGTLDSQWHLHPWLSGCRQVVAHNPPAKAAAYVHPSEDAHVTHVGGKGYAVLRPESDAQVFTLG
jgi:hypothetical protein